MKDLKAILDLLFYNEETCCPSDSKFSYHSVPISSVLSGQVTLVSPNQKVATRTVKTEELVLLAINPIKGFRNDDNVTANRTFMFEADTGNLGAQLQYASNIGLPWSAAIFSGNKSIHFLVVIDQDLDNKTYRLLYEWALNIGTLFDSSCKNPSRSVRIPGAIRPETGKEQKLIKINGKIKLDDFMAWLNKHPECMPKPREKRKILTGEPDYSRLSGWVRNMLQKNSIDFKIGRNRRWFSIAYDFAKNGYSEQETVEILSNWYEEESDFKEREWLTAIKSAFKGQKE